MPVYRYLADAVVVLHVAYVLAVVLGLLATLAGYLFRWVWVRNFWLRGVHLAMIMVVVVHALLGATCPLTTLEHDLRRQAGEKFYEGSFLGYWAHQLLFIDAPPWAFTATYCLFGLVVLATFVLVPPRWPGRAVSRG